MPIERLKYVSLGVYGITFLVSLWSAFIDPHSLKYTWPHLSILLIAISAIIWDFKIQQLKSLLTSNIATALIFAGWYYGFAFWPWKGGPVGRYDWENQAIIGSYACLIVGWPLVLVHHFRSRCAA